MSFKGAFFKKILDWIPNLKESKNGFVFFFIKQINPGSLRSWCVKGTKNRTDFFLEKKMLESDSRL